MNLSRVHGRRPGPGPRHSPARRAWQTLVLLLLLVMVVNPVAAAPAADPDAPTVTGPLTQPVPTLTAATFTDPPATVRPKYRWWMPLSKTDDAELASEIQAMKDSGGGGFEIVPFNTAGPGNNSNPFLETYGFGTDLWSHKVQVMTQKAADLGLIADQTIGVRWPPAVNTVSNFNVTAAAKQIIFGREVNNAGSTRSGALPSPTSSVPSVSSSLTVAAAVGDTKVKIAATANLAAGDQIVIGSTNAETVTIKTVNAPSPAATISAPAAIGDGKVYVGSVANFEVGNTATLGSATGQETVTITSVGIPAGTATTLFADAAAGATNVKVPAMANFVTGQAIAIDTGSSMELRTVTAFGTTGTATTLSAATTAGATNIKVAAVTDLTIGDTLTVDSGASKETVTISAVGTAGASGTGVTVSPALTLAHASNAAVRDQSKTGTGITFTPALSQAHSMNASVTLLGTGIGFSPSLAKTHASGESLTVVSSSGVDLTAALTKAHAAGETVVDTAVKTRIAVLVAQCTDASNCSTSGTSPRLLDASSVKDVSSQVDANGNLSYTFPTGNGNPWFLIVFWYTSDGQTLAGYTPTTPNYITDHLSTAGAKALTDFYDKYVFNNSATVAALKAQTANGIPSMFEDSLELGSTTKWTPDMIAQWKSLRGYDPTLYLPALAGIGSWAHLRASNYNYDGATTPYFDFGTNSISDPTTIGSRVRWDYAQMWSDLFYTRYAKTLQTWAQGYGITVDFQVHGEPIDGGAAGLYVGTPQGEGLEFNDGPGHPITQWKIYSSGTNVVGNSTMPCECTAISGQVWSTTVPMEIAEDSSTTAVRPGTYAHFAGGMNWVIYHGFAYNSAPEGSGSQALWPGYSYGGNTSYSEAHGPRQPQWSDYKKVNDNIGRLSLVLRQGKPKFDVGVYGESLGTAGQGAYRPGAYYYEETSAMAQAGYTYSYVGPEHLKLANAVYLNGALFPGYSDYKALVLTDQPQIRLDAAQRILFLAQQGLPVVIVGTKDPSSITTPGYNTANDSAVQTAMKTLYGYAGDGVHKVVRVVSETYVPAALQGLGITADAAHTSAPESSAIIANHRQTTDVDYYYLYNQTASAVTQTLTLKGTGIPYTLDSWSGKITPIADYTSSDGAITLQVALGAYNQTVVAITGRSDDTFKPVSAVHAVSTTADKVLYRYGVPYMRATQAGTYKTTLSDGRTIEGTVSDVPSSSYVGSWTLTVDSWTPDATDLPGLDHTAHTTVGPVTLTGSVTGTLPAWTAITPANGYSANLQDVSGIGTYTAIVNLGGTFNGAYLKLGTVVDTSSVTVNGTTVPAYDYIDPNRIDIGPYLKTGDNTVVVKVASTLRNAVRVAPNSGSSSRTRQDCGLMGPVQIVPYQDVRLGSASLWLPAISK